LEVLDISHNEIGLDYDEEISKIFAQSINNKYLKEINLSHNYINDDLGKCIINGLFNNMTLEKINLSNNKFGENTKQSLSGLI